MKRKSAYIFLVCVYFCCSHHLYGSEQNKVPDLPREKRFLAYEGGPTSVNKNDWNTLEQARKNRENSVTYYLHRYVVHKNGDQNYNFSKK